MCKEFKEERIKHRIESLCKRAEVFISQNKLEGKVGINTELLRIAVLDYFADIERLKRFNPDIVNINLHKIYAYSAYWWLRRKPIQVIRNLENEDLCYINEKFIASYLIYEMNRISGLVKYQNVLNVNFKDSDVQEYLETLEYYLIYRVKDAQSIEMILETYEFCLTLVKKKYGKNEKDKSEPQD